MAKNIKGRKFVATAASAALVASAIVPVASAASTDYADAGKIADWAKDAVAYTTEKGLFEGDKGNFNPTKNLTRAEAVAVVVRALDLKVDETKKSTFADVPANHWASSFIAALVAHDADIITGKGNNKFDPSGQITREEFAKIIVLAFGLKLNEKAEIPFTDLSGWSKEFVEILYSNGYVDGVAPTSFSPKSTVNRQQAATFLHRHYEESVRVQVKEKAPTELVVQSATALNNKEILITFNKELDKDVAETAANYTLSSGTATPTLGADKKSVILTLSSAAAQQSSLDVTIKNVKDVDGKTVAETKKTVTFLDTTLPTATSVQVIGPKTLKVNFSEPMQTAPTYKLNGGAYSVSASLAADGKSATLTVGAVLPTGEHTLEVAGGSDYSSATGFAIIKQELKFNYTPDTAAPVAQVVKANELSVTLKFSKPVSTANLNTDVTAYHTINNSANYKGTITAVSPSGGYADTFVVTFATPIPAGTGKVLFLNTKENKMEDLWGNDVASTSYSFNIVSDVAGPSVTKVEATGKAGTATAQKELTVTFNEEIVKADAENRLNYVLKDAQGNIVKTSDYAGVDSKGNLVGTTFAYTASKNEVKVNLGTVLKPGSYKLEVSNIKDVSFAGNKMATQVVDFTVADQIPPSVGATTYVSANNTLFVDFSEPMDTTGLGNIANYFLGTDTFPAGSTVEVVNNQRVKITLPSNHGLSGSKTVAVIGSLKDVAGNPIGGLSQNSTSSFTIGTSTAFTITPAAKQVKLIAANQLQFVLPTELSAIDVTRFTFNGTGDNSGLTVTSATYVNSNGKSTVTVTLSNDLATTDVTGITSLELAADAVTNVLGTKVSGTTTFATANGEFEDKLASKITNVETISATTVRVTFSEVIPAGEIANASFVVAGNTVASVSHTGGTNSAVITLVNAIDTADKPAVTQLLDIKDVAGNVLVAGTAVKATADKAAPVITSAVLTTDVATADSKLGAVGDVLTLTFSETPVMTLTDTTADADGYYDMTVAEFEAITGLTGTGGAFKAKVVGKTIVIELTTALTTAINADNTVNALGTASTQIKDAAGNAQAAATGVKLTK